MNGVDEWGGNCGGGDIGAPEPATSGSGSRIHQNSLDAWAAAAAETSATIVDHILCITKIGW